MNNLSPLDSVRQSLERKTVQDKMNGVSAAASRLKAGQDDAPRIVALNLPKHLAVIGASIGAANALKEHGPALNALATEVNDAFGAVVEQNAAYQAQIERHEAHASKTKEELSTQQTVISELTLRLTDSQSALHSLTQEKSELTSRMEELNAKAEAVQSEAGVLREQNAEIPQLRATLTEKTEALSKLEALKGQLDGQLGSLSKELSSIRAQAANSNHESNQALQKQQQELSQLQSQTSEQISSLTAEISTLKAQLSDKESIQTKLSEKEAEVDSLNAKLRTLDKQVDSKQTKIDELNEQVSKLTSEVEEATATLSAQTSMMTSSQAELTSQVQELRNANRTQQSTIERQGTEIESLRQANEQAPKPVDDSAKCKKLMAQIQDLQGRIYEMGQRLTAKQERQDELTSEVRGLREELVQADATSSKYLDILASQNAELDNLNEENEAYNEAEVEEDYVEEEYADTSVDQEEVTALRNELHFAKQALAEKETIADALVDLPVADSASDSERFKQLKAAFTALQKQVYALNRRLASDEMRQAKQEAQLALEVNEELTAENANLTAGWQELNKENAELNSAMKALEEELTQVNLHYNRKISIIDNLDKENRELLAQVKELEAINEEFGEAEDRNLDVFNKVKAMRDEYRNQLGDANDAVVELEEQIEKMKAKSSTSALGMAGKVVQGGLAATAVAMMASEPVNQAVTSTIRGLAGRLTSYDTYRQLGVQAGQAWTTHGAPMMQRAGQALSDYGTPVLKGAGQMWSDYGTPVVQGAGQMWSDYGTPVVQGASTAVMNAVNNPDDAEHGALGFTPKQILVSSVLLVGSVATTVFFWRRSAKKATPAAQE